MRSGPRRHYDAPPLEEAIFELFVWPSPSPSWSSSLADDMTARLTSYAGKREDLENLNVRLQLGPGKSVTQGVDSGPPRRRLWNAEQTRAVQFGAEMCTHNVRRPYGHFEDHLSPMREVFAAYLNVAKPERIGWVGQRYLNFVKLPLDASPSTYFRLYPQLPAELPSGHRPFAVQVETAKFEQGSTLVNVALLELNPDAAVYTVDIYARSDETVPIAIDAIMEWQERAHTSIGDSFELTITPEARTLFKEAPCPP